MIQQVSTAKYNRGQMEQKTLDDFSIDSDTDDDEKESREPQNEVSFTKQTTMSLRERFDKNALAYLVEHSEEFRRITLDRRPAEDDSYDPFLKPKQYLQESRDGIASVSYHKARSDKLGRWLADGSLSMQNFRREIRHTIAKDFYDDVDMVNAHPVILQHMCKKHDIPCQHLSRYIEDRETVLQEVVDANKRISAADSDEDSDDSDEKDADEVCSVSRGSVKRCVLSMINGGFAAYKKIPNKSAWLKKFYREIRATKRSMEDVYQSFFDKVKSEKLEDEEFTNGKRDYRNSALSRLFCDVENRILMHMADFLRNHGAFRDIGVLCFDGIMIPKGVSKELVQQCAEYASEKIGFRVDLKVKPMDEGFDLPDDIPEYREITGIDPTDPFVWLDFDHKYRGEIFESMEDLIRLTTYDLRRVYARVEIKKCYHIRKSNCDSELHDIISGDAKFTDMYFRYKTKKGKIKELTFSKYIQYAAKKIMRYSSIDFEPGCEDPRKFNLFTGYKASLLDNYDINKIKRPLLHIRDIICNGDPKIFKYFMSWLAAMLTRPGKRTGVVPVLYSAAQGTGKNSIFTFIANNVVGSNYVREIIGLKPITEKHNTVLQGRKLLVINEASSVSGSFVADFNTLKSLITDSSIYIDPKGKDGFDIKNLLELALTTNHDNSLHLEDKDRRYLCLEVSESKVGDSQYFNKLHKSFTNEAGNHFLTYLAMECNGFPYGKKPPMTPLKQYMLEVSNCNPIKFLKARPWEGDGDSSDSEDDSDEDSEDDSEVDHYNGKPGFSAQEVYDAYVKWCSNEGEKPKKKNAFQQKIKPRVKDVIITKKRKYYYDLFNLRL